MGIKPLSKKDWIELNLQNQPDPEEVIKFNKEQDVLFDEYLAEQETESGQVELQTESVVPIDEGEGEEFVPKTFKGKPGDPYSYRTKEDGGYEFFDTRKEDATWETAKKQVTTKGSGKTQHEAIDDINPFKMRSDKIWNGAIKDGKVHKNMRKSGYKPQNER